MRSRSKRTVVLLSGIALVGIDQLLKVTVGVPSLHVASGPLKMFGGVVVVGLGFAAYVLGWRRDRGATLAALCLICAGSCSNFLDRVLRGQVMVYLPRGGGRHFNLADAAISVGLCLTVVLIVVWIVRRMRLWLRRSSAG